MRWSCACTCIARYGCIGTLKYVCFTLLLIKSARAYYTSTDVPSASCLCRLWSDNSSITFANEIRALTVPAACCCIARRLISGGMATRVCSVWRFRKRHCLQLELCVCATRPCPCTPAPSPSLGVPPLPVRFALSDSATFLKRISACVLL